jgi:dephospho-CoA kinase
VIDADQVARDVTAPGSAGERAVLEHFGDRAMAPIGRTRQTGRLDRAALADIVFSDPSERLALEAITHPLIRVEVLRRAAQAERDALATREAPAGKQVVVIEVPLLDEPRKLDYGLDVAVLIDVPEDVAVRRAVARGMTEAAARARIAAQPSRAQRRLLADRALVNDGDLGDLEIAVDDLWGWLLAKTAPGLS